MVAPRVAEVERGWKRDLHAGRLQLSAQRVLVVDDEPEVTVGVGRLRSSAREREELVAHVDERHRLAGAAAQREVEEAPVPGERLVDVADLERDMVDPDELHHDMERSSSGTLCACVCSSQERRA